jgi:hypothetical protein
MTSSRLPQRHQLGRIDPPPRRMDRKEGDRILHVLHIRRGFASVAHQPVVDANGYVAVCGQLAGREDHATARLFISPLPAPSMDDDHCWAWDTHRRAWQIEVPGAESAGEAYGMSRRIWTVPTGHPALPSLLLAAITLLMDTPPGRWLERSPGTQ